MKKTAFDAFETNALLYQEKYMDLHLYDDTYDAFLERLKPDASVLELGCGPGNVTRYLLDKRPDLKLFATDFSPKMLSLAESNVPNASFRQMDARQIASLSEKFDATVCGFIAPYLERSALLKLIADCEKLLSADGSLYLSTIEGEYENSGWQSSSDGRSSTIVYLYPASDVKEMLFQNGFSAVSISRKSFGDSSHLIFIAGFS